MLGSHNSIACLKFEGNDMASDDIPSSESLNKRSERLCDEKTIKQKNQRALRKMGKIVY